MPTTRLDIGMFSLHTCANHMLYAHPDSLLTE
jgi:hypothetical protein